MFVAIQSLGEGIGPVVGADLSARYGFETAQLIFGIGLGSFCVLYFIFCGFFTMCAFEKAKKDEDGEKKGLINAR